MKSNFLIILLLCLIFGEGCRSEYAGLVPSNHFTRFRSKTSFAGTSIDLVGGRYYFNNSFDHALLRQSSGYYFRRVDSIMLEPDYKLQSLKPLPFYEAKMASDSFSVMLQMPSQFFDPKLYIVGRKDSVACIAADMRARKLTSTTQDYLGYYRCKAYNDSFRVKVVIPDTLRVKPVIINRSIQTEWQKGRSNPSLFIGLPREYTYYLDRPDTIVVRGKRGYLKSEPNLEFTAK